MGEKVGRAKPPTGRPSGLPTSLGFRDGAASVHTSRTMMLGELTLLLGKVPAPAKASDYAAAVVDDNLLGKPTQTTRKRTAQRLTELYALDPTCTLFRLLRHFWATDQAGRPMLAYLTAAARDPLLRETTPFVLGVPDGQPLGPNETAKHLGETYPNRFQSSTALATAQRLASSWTQAGYLRGKVKKVRTRPAATAAVVAHAAVFGYLCGLRGRSLLDSTWTRLLGLTPSEVADAMGEASRQGWLSYKAAGSVVEVTFPGLLKPHEEDAARDAD